MMGGSWGRIMFRRQSHTRKKQIILCAALLAGITCAPLSSRSQTPSGGGEWHEFQGTCTAAGNRQVISLGGDRKASITDLTGSLVLSGPSRPAVGFGAEAIVFNDSLTGLVGRGVWTDEHGDKIFSELRGETTGLDHRLFGTFIGGSGRYAGATGSYEFAWRYLIEGEDGTVQGQCMGLKGRVRAGPPPSAPTAGSSR